MNIKKINNNYLIENINPGLDVKSIDYAIKDFTAVFDNGIIVVGGDLGCTCEEIDVKKLLKVIEKYKSNKDIKFILAGALGKELEKYVNYPYMEHKDIKSVEYDENILIIYRKSIINPN